VWVYFKSNEVRCLMKHLIFNVKRNLKKPPKIYVVSPDKKITYGSFSASNPDEFENWDALSIPQKIELTQYMHNMQAICNHLDASSLNEQTDFRLRLPLSFIQCINEINTLAIKNDVEMDLFEPILVALIQQLKIVSTKLPANEKKLAFAAIEKIGLSEYRKMDYSKQIQGIFHSLLAIPNKSEKLQLYAKELFNKDKIITPKSIEDIANGNLTTSKWVVACAIEILLIEHPTALEKGLSADDLFMLWVKPLQNSKYLKHELITKAKLLKKPELVTRIENTD
jgi:hypothetical protein